MFDEFLGILNSAIDGIVTLIYVGAIGVLIWGQAEEYTRRKGAGK